MTKAQVSELIARQGYKISRETADGYFIQHVMGGAEQFYARLDEIAFFFNRTA